MNRHKRYSLAACALGALGLWQPASGAVAQAATAVAGLRFGLTSVILSEQAAFLARWSSYLSSRVGVRVQFVVRESYQTILDFLFGQQLDAAWVCGYPYVLHRHRLQLLAVPVYRGEPLYRAMLIRPVGARDPVRGWSDVRGRVLAYSDPLSNSGWLVAQEQLQNAGVGARELKRSFFAYGHRNVAEAVATQLADAGCIDGYVWETMRQWQMPTVHRTEVVWTSEPFGFPPVVARAGALSTSLRVLREVLLDMPRDGDGRELLASLNLGGFTQAGASLYDPIAAMARRRTEPGA